MKYFLKIHVKFIFPVRVHRQLISMFVYGVERSKDHHEQNINEGSYDDSTPLSSNHNDLTSSLPSPTLPSLYPLSNPQPSPSSPLTIQSTEI